MTTDTWISGNLRFYLDSIEPHNQALIIRYSGPVHLRQMTHADIPAGLRLCRAAGWNQLESDWRCFLELNPEGCRVAESESRVAGTVTTLRYEAKFSWISMVLVDPEM